MRGDDQYRDGASVYNGDILHMDLAVLVQEREDVCVNTEMHP